MDWVLLVTIHAWDSAWTGRGEQSSPAKTMHASVCAGRYAAERRGGFPWLRFSAALEQEFRGALTQMTRARLRFSMPVAMLATLAILLIDPLLAQPLMTPVVRLVVALLLLPLLVMTAWFHAPNADWGRRQRSLFLLVLSTHLIVAAAVHEARSGLPSYPYEPFLMAALFGYFLSGLMFWWALGLGAVSCVCFVVSSMALGGVHAHELFYLTVTHVAGSMGLYFYEHQQRQSFLLARELRWKADIDPLSGLMNHGAVKQHMRRSWAQSVREHKQVAVLMIDIDHFKAVNDGHGHVVGDRVIQAVGTVLQDSLRRPLDAAGRLGGDEFVAMWFDVDADWMVLQAARIRQQLTTLVGPLGADGRRVTLSIGGVCVGPASGVKLERILQHADSMLYQVKREGRDNQRVVELEAPAALGEQADSVAVA